MTVRHKAEFIVIIKDNPAVACDPEVFKEEIAWEDIAGRQFLYGSAVIKNGFFCSVPVFFPDEKVKGSEPSFRVKMSESDTVLVDKNRFLCVCSELV